jgi:mevalonate kinase
MYSGITRNTSQIDEVKRLIEKITQEINQSLDVLSSSSTNLLKVEVSHGDLLFDQLLRNLNESNNRLKNISSVYQDAKGR